MNRIIPIFLCLFLYVSVLVQGQDTTRLEAGHRIVRDLAASEKHTYLIDLDAKQFVYGEFNQKGMNVPQQFGSASSYAKKYALGNLFLIDDTADSDATNTHDKGNVAKPKLQGAALTKAKAFIK